MSAHTEALTDAAIDAHLDAILRASGSALRHYSMHKTICDMRAALRSAVAALSLPDPSAAPVVPQWLPIESAPKDGAEFLGWTRKVRALILYWDGERWSDGMSRFERSPSHWMPLPPAPQQGERAGQEGEQG